MTVPATRAQRGAFGSISAALLVCAVASSGEGCVTSVDDGLATAIPLESSADEAAEVEAEQHPQAAEPSEPAQPERPPPWQPPEQALLAGVDGAAQLLADGKPEAALARLDELDKLDTSPGEAALEPESREWFMAGAVAGRAYMLTQQWELAVLVLEPLAASKQFAKQLPRDIVGHALARARMGWAAQLRESQPATADLQLRRAIDELGALKKFKPARIQAAIRVAQGEAMAMLRGKDARAIRSAATKAIKALDRLITDYPNHPEVGEWMLERALAMARVDTKAARAESELALRQVAIARAGEPEAKRAWAALEQRASEAKSELPPLDRDESLAAGQAARGLRRLVRSRELLEPLWQDEKQPRHIHREAGFSLGWTYYKSRDYEACAKVYAELYADIKSIETRKDFSRCLERAGRYQEAVDLWVAVYEGNKGAYGASSLWKAVGLAVDGGLYQRADDLLREYESRYKGNASDRRWLHAWLPMRMGQDELAREKFAELLASKRTGGREREITYFLGKLELRATDPELRAAGVARLRTVADFGVQRIVAGGVIGGHPIYYGLLARQQLVDAGEDPGELPQLEPLAWEQEERWIGHGETLALLGRMAEEHGELFSSLVRAEQLFAAGWREEASRESRVASDEFINGRAVYSGSDMPGTRSEALVAGLAWAPEWRHPTAVPGKSARKALRDEELRERLRVDFMTLSWAMQEPYRFAKLTTDAEAATYRSRWHLRAYREPIERNAWEREVDPHHMWALMYTESRFRRHVVSYVGARGALQIMSYTGRYLSEDLEELGDDERFNPDILFDIQDNSRLAVFYITQLLEKFHGQAPFAYGSYNGGPNNVARWLRVKAASPKGIELDEFVEEIPFRETGRYVRRVMEVHATYGLLYRGELPSWSMTVDPDYESNIDY